MKRIKKRPLALAVCLFLAMGLLPSAALAADPGSRVYVGGVELIGSADQPAYATTDFSGTVKPGGSQDNYNIKWDGATLTLNGANVTGWYSYVDYYGDSNIAAIYRDGDIQISLVGENTVTGLDTDTDVAADSWYSDAVDYVRASGLMNGTGDSTFSPDMAASRSTVVAILWRMEGSPEVDYWMDFSDVDQAAWYGEAVRWAASQGVAGGYGSGDGSTLGPQEQVTRAQAAAMLMRFCQGAAE